MELVATSFVAIRYPNKKAEILIVKKILSY